MQKLSRRTILAAVVAVSLGAASVVYAQSSMAGMAHDHMMGGASAQGHMMGGMQALTLEQQESAKKLLTEFETTTTDLRQELTNKYIELNAQANGAAPDAVKIETLFKEIGVLQGKFWAERASLSAKLFKAGILTMGQGMMGMGDQNCMEMGSMAFMRYGTNGGSHGHSQPAGGQRN